jgi:hypothetical protein
MHNDPLLVGACAMQLEHLKLASAARSAEVQHGTQQLWYRLCGEGKHDTYLMHMPLCLQLSHATKPATAL